MDQKQAPPEAAIRSDVGKQLADCKIWLERDGTEPPLERFATVSLRE